jgi:hypothetical protein
VLVIKRQCDWGHETRNLALPRCAGTHLLFIDDDDRYLSGALALVRERVSALPRKVHLFAMALDYGVVIKPSWPLVEGHIGTPMFCVPRVRRKLGRWSNRYEGDYDFIRSTMGLRGDLPVLHEDVIALIAARQ